MGVNIRIPRGAKQEIKIQREERKIALKKIKNRESIFLLKIMQIIFFFNLFIVCNLFSPIWYWPTV